MNDAFQKDCLDILAGKVERGEISRRRFAQLAATLLAGAPFALRAGSARAAEKQLVLVNWGGDAIKAYDAAFGQPFFKETGITVKEDGTGPTEGAIAAQFKSGKPTWDLVDADPFSAISLGKQGMMEPIDYSIVDKSKMRPGFNWDYAASTYFFSYVIAYDAKKFGANPPKSMADFFDVKTYPGKRSMYKWGAGMWEAALLADGVAPEKLYPLDLKRAHDKIAAFKDNVVSYWGGGAASQQVMLSGDASMAIIWSTRASLLDKDTAGQIKFIWDQGLISPGALGGDQEQPRRQGRRDEIHRQHLGPEKAARHLRHAGPRPRQSGDRRADPGRQEEIQSGRPGQYESPDRARYALVCRQLWRGARRLHQDHLGMSERRLAAAASFSPAGERAPHAASVAPEPASGTKRTNRARASKWIALCFIAPLARFPGAGLCRAVPRRRRMERHAAQSPASDNMNGSPLIRSSCRSSCAPSVFARS